MARWRIDDDLKVAASSIHPEHLPADGLSDAPVGDSANDPRLGLLMLSAFAIGQAIHINNGFLHPAALGWLGLAGIFLTATFLPSISGRFVLLRRVRFTALAAICIAIQGTQLVVWEIRWASSNPATIACLAVCAAGAMVAMIRPLRWRWAAVLLVAGHLGACGLTIRALPRPRIDVWMFQQDSTAALLQGADPYAVRFPDIYGQSRGFYGPEASTDGWLTYSYPYPPLTLLLTAPGRMLGDVRWSHLLALEAAAVLMILAARGARAVVAAAMLLLSPASMLVAASGWTEPMVLLSLALLGWCIVKQPAKSPWLALGLLFAMKQYTVLAAPIAATTLLPRPLRRRPVATLLCNATLVAAATMLPFFLWNPSSFFRSVVLWQFRQPFRMDALTYCAFVARETGLKPGSWIGFVGAAAAMVLAGRNIPRNSGVFFAAFSLMMLLFFALNKQAFYNYYFLVIGTICQSLALSQAGQSVQCAGQEDYFEQATDTRLRQAA